MDSPGHTVIFPFYPSFNLFLICSLVYFLSFLSFFLLLSVSPFFCFTSLVSSLLYLSPSFLLLFTPSFPRLPPSLHLFLLYPSRRNTRYRRNHSSSSCCPHRPGRPCDSYPLRWFLISHLQWRVTGSNEGKLLLVWTNDIVH